MEGAIGFAHPWNDADGDVMDRVIGGSELPVASDMAPPSEGGRSIHFGTTSTAIYREFDRTYGADGSSVWVSYRWISTDTTSNESLQLVDFNDSSGGFGCVIGQIRGLAGADLADGMYDLGDHSSGVHTPIAPRDQAIHFVLLRFTFGPGDADLVDLWWDPMEATFDANSPHASIAVTDASFSRITFRSGTSADSVDEFYLGSTLESVTQSVNQMSVYRIGNSLTWDSQPEGIEAMAAQAGFVHDEGFHINCGNTLTNIVSNPSQVCISPVGEYGTWDTALSGHRWHAVTMQPFRGGTSTLASDEASILALIDEASTNPLNADTVYYVYAAWPMLPDYAMKWDGVVVDDDATPTVLARQYFDYLMGRLRLSTQSRVYLIPVGEVLYDLDARLRAGAVPGLTRIDDLYRDGIHLSHDLGRFVAALTTYATLYATDPTGIIKPESWYGTTAAAYSPEFYMTVYESVWSVVSGHEFTGVE